jgi:hypothetical protein
LCTMHLINISSSKYFKQTFYIIMPYLKINSLNVTFKLEVYILHERCIL